MLHPTATCCNTLQHAETHCNTLQHTVAYCCTLQHACKALQRNAPQRTITHHSTMPCTTTHYTTLQHTATHEHTAKHCNTLQHTATQAYYDYHLRAPITQRAAITYTLQYSAAHCIMPAIQHPAASFATSCNTMQPNALQYATAQTCAHLHTLFYNTAQHSATQCNTLQHGPVIITIIAQQRRCATVSNTLQHTATHCNMPATHCNTTHHTTL